jgi:hypothetical protein
MEIVELLSNIDENSSAYKPPPFCEREQAKSREG